MNGPSAGGPAFCTPPRLIRAVRALAAIGVVAGVAGAIVNPDRLWTDWLLASFYLLGIALGGLFFVALQYVTGARWSLAFRRVPEALAATLPVAILCTLVGVLGRPSLYPWTRTAIGPETGAFRQVWLTWPFFAARAMVYAAVWAGFALAILAASRRGDGEEASTGRVKVIGLNTILPAPAPVLCEPMFRV